MFKRGDAVDPRSLDATGKLVSFMAAPQTMMSRDSGFATYARLQAMFPYIGTYAAVSEFSSAPKDGTNQALGSKARPISAQAQYTLRKYTTVLCANLASGSPLFTADASILMGGESTPQDVATQAAFVVARRAWLFPYLSDSGEVQALAALYKGIAYDLKGNPDPSLDKDAKQILCVSALTSPNFWIGNQSPYDVVRRLALELARRPPTFQEYDDYVNKRMTIQDYARALQKEAGYMTAVNQWHKDWLSLYWDNPVSIYEMRPRMTKQGSYLGTYTANVVRYNFDIQEGQYQGANNQLGRFGMAYGNYFSAPPLAQAGPKMGNALVRFEGETGVTSGIFSSQNSSDYGPNYLPTSQFPNINRAQAAENKGYYLSYWGVNFGAADPHYGYETVWNPVCDVTKDQDFDPRTTEVIWEQYNSHSAQWEMIGEWKLVSGTWQKLNGTVTLANNSTITTSLDDIVYAQSDNFGVSADPYRYQPNYPKGYTSKLIGTPLEVFYARDRRVRRISPSGEQDGVSVVTLPRTGTTARTCNSIDRYLSTCALRPNTRNSGDFFEKDYTQWTPAGGKLMSIYWPAGSPPRYSIMSPFLLNSMKCGTPNLAEMSKINSGAYATPEADPEEDMAWPWAYDNSDNALNPYGSTNVSAAKWASDSTTMTALKAQLNSRTDFAAFGDFWVYGYDTWMETELDALNPSLLEAQAEMVLKNDLAQEPYRLIDDIIANNKDYRLLVTANYTFGTDYYEKLLREQGYFLPGGPQLKTGGGFVPASTNKPASLPVHPIFFSDFADIPIQVLESVTREHSDNDATYMNDLVAIGRISPKLHAGLLNMPAFLTQYNPLSTGSALGNRTMADRYFTRLMCGNPSMFTPSGGQIAIQSAYVPNVEGAAGGPNPHLDQTKGCYQCHINMDPLASALNRNFSLDIKKPAFGEIRFMDSTNSSQGATYGVRGGGPPSTGAFLGSVMHGLGDVSQTLANSTQFNSCVIKKVMEQVMGRDPVIADIKDFNRVLGAFMKSHNYNDMVVDLVSMPEFTAGE